MPLLEAIEQRAGAQGVPVDARIEVGRSYRHALLRLLESETVDRVIVSATALPRVGFSGDDLVWLLQEAPAEVLILRPAPEDTRVISANNGSRPNGALHQERAGPRSAFSTLSGWRKSWSKLGRADLVAVALQEARALELGHVVGLRARRRLSRAGSGLQGWPATAGGSGSDGSAGFGCSKSRLRPMLVA